MVKSKSTSAAESGHGNGERTSRTDDLRIENVMPLPPPEHLIRFFPIAGTPVEQLISTTRDRVRRIMRREDDRLLVIMGPCSIHDPLAAVEYAKKLRAERERHAGTLEIVMRVYFEKPRTTVGWKGYINDPHLDGTFAINEGLERARRLLLELTMLGLPTGTEFLDLLSPQFIAELVAWGAIGARTTESQSHRQLASGLSCPVGFKNGTDGSIQVAADAILAARAPHAFMGMTKMGVAAIFETRGNDDCHLILRGGKAPNYDEASITASCAVLDAAGLRPQVMVDISHGNSGKRHERQGPIAAELAGRIARGERRIFGLMVESHLEAGRQELVPGQALRHGVSITDACIGFDETVPLLRSLASAVAARRRLALTGPSTT